MVAPSQYTPSGDASLHRSDASGILNSVSKNNSKLKSTVNQELMQAAAKGIVFFAFSPVVQGFAAKVKIVVASSVGFLTNSAYCGEGVAQLKTQLAATGLQNLKTSIRQLPVGTGIEMIYFLLSSCSPTSAEG